MNKILSIAGKFLLKTKLFWGLAVLYAAGIILSPLTGMEPTSFFHPATNRTFSAKSRTTA